MTRDYIFFCTESWELSVNNSLIHITFISHTEKYKKVNSKSIFFLSPPMGKGHGFPLCPLLLFLGGERDEQYRGVVMVISKHMPACAWVWKEWDRSQVPSLPPHKAIMSTPLPSKPALSAIMSLNCPGFLWSSLQTTKPSAAVRQRTPDRRCCPICREDDMGAVMIPCNPAPCPGGPYQAAGWRHGPWNTGILRIIIF